MSKWLFVVDALFCVVYITLLFAAVTSEFPHCGINKVQSIVLHCIKHEMC